MMLRTGLHLEKKKKKKLNNTSCSYEFPLKISELRKHIKVKMLKLILD